MDSYALRIIAYFLLLCYCNAQVQLPTIRWDPENPLFHDSKCSKNGSAHIYADVMSLALFTCPSLTQIDWVQTEKRHAKNLYENLYVVTKKEFDTCELNKTNGYSKILLKCDDVYQVNQVKYLKVLFERYISSSDRIPFIAGETYYFISTSNSTLPSLKNERGGNCKSKNMKLAITMCPAESNCGLDEYRCNGLPKPTTTTTSTTKTEDMAQKKISESTQKETVTKTETEVETENEKETPIVQAATGENDDDNSKKQNATAILLYVLVFVIGLLNGVVIMFLFNRWNNKRMKSRNNSDTTTLSYTGSEVFTTKSGFNSSNIIKDKGEVLNEDELRRREANLKYFSSENSVYRNSTEFKRLLSTNSNNSSERYSASPVGEYA